MYAPRLGEFTSPPSAATCPPTAPTIHGTRTCFDAVDGAVGKLPSARRLRIRASGPSAASRQGSVDAEDASADVESTTFRGT